MSKTPEELADEYAFNIFKERYESLDYEEKNVYANAVIAFLAAYQAAAPQWISVKDRMPKSNEDEVLFCTTTNTIHKGYCYIRLQQWDYADNCLPLPLNEVTHWMPLPEPPKEEK